jgi:eukaryotic-like serine/threonine-protein kinase
MIFNGYQTSMPLERGSILNHRYRIVEILGQGGMGSIYRAVDQNLGVDVAVKENLFTTEEYARQFRREAIILASLRHPNLPRVTDHFVIEGQGQYLVMDFIEGEDLRERMDREGVLSDIEVVVLGTAICEALSYLHSRQPQVVHRDIKPGNVKITPNGHIILVDFGLAKVIQGSQATTTGARAMTPGYSPPEQYGTARTDHRTDIYSLGATLYVALTGNLPEDALARAMEQADITPVRKYNSKVSKRLAGVVEKALELRPDDRFQSAEEFKKALLNSRVITGQREGRELTVTPPPVAAEVEAMVGNGEAALGRSSAQRNQIHSSTAGFESMLLPASTPISEPFSMPAYPQRRKRRIRRSSTALLLVGVILLGALGAYTYQPSLLDRARAWIAPALALVVSPTPTPTDPSPATQPLLSATDNPALLPSETLPVLPVEPATETPTELPTFTPEPENTSTPTPTAVGGGSGEIAYASDLTGIPQVWMMNADGTAHRQITNMEEGACQPDWSPDGNRLVFISPCAFNQEIYPGASLFIVNADGTEVTPLPTQPGGDFDPVWSPDGESIAFTSLRDFNRAQIYLISLEDNSVRSLSDNTVRDAQPFWSPDGSKIAFITTRRGPYQIWTMDSDGGNPALFSRSGSLKNSRPVWSPDGQIILFTQSEILGGIPRLIAARLEEGIFRENRITRELTPMREATFSPDGYWIAFESWPDGTNHDIFVMTLNEVGKQQLTDDASFEFDPVWRPVPVRP